MPDAPRIETPPWERRREWTEVAFDSRIVTVRAATALYEQESVFERIEPFVPAHIDESPRGIFTTGLAFDPPPPVDKTPAALLDVAAKYAGREFQRSLTEDGLENVERTGTQELRLAGRRTATAFQFDAEYPLDAGGGRRAALDVRVWAALWPTEESFEMAGGIYPLGDLRDALERAGASTQNDVSLQARPAADRQEVLDRIREAAN